MTFLYKISPELVWCCSTSFSYSCLLGLLAPVTDGLSRYVQELLAIGRKGCTGRDLNEKTLAADNGR